MNSIISFFKDILYNLGLWKKNATLIFLGLENAGKSTLLTILKTGKVIQVPPTSHATMEEDIKIGKLNLKVHDLGGHEAMRTVWEDYFPKIDGIIYIVDSADPDKFETSKSEFEKIINNDQIGNIPILILGNKVDKKEAVEESEFKLKMGFATETHHGIQDINEINGKKIYVRMCSIGRKSGYVEGLKWLSDALP